MTSKAVMKVNEDVIADDVTVQRRLTVAQQLVSVEDFVGRKFAGVEEFEAVIHRPSVKLHQSVLKRDETDHLCKIWQKGMTQRKLTGIQTNVVLVMI